jgi:hypothetical protein
MSLVGPAGAAGARLALGSRADHLVVGRVLGRRLGLQPCFGLTQPCLARGPDRQLGRQLIAGRFAELLVLGGVDGGGGEDLGRDLLIGPVRRPRRVDCSHAIANFEFEQSIRRPARRTRP